MSTTIMFRGSVLSFLAVGLSCTAGSDLGQTESVQTTRSALTGPLQFDWEDGSLQGWQPFGNPTLENSTEQAFTGTRSLKTTNRTATFMGPSIQLASQLSPG